MLYWYSSNERRDRGKELRRPAIGRVSINVSSKIHFNRKFEFGKSFVACVRKNYPELSEYSSGIFNPTTHSAGAIVFANAVLAVCESENRGLEAAYAENVSSRNYAIDYASECIIEFDVRKRMSKTLSTITVIRIEFEPTLHSSNVF